MTLPAFAGPSLGEPATGAGQSGPDANPDGCSCTSLYGTPFWMAYAANVLVAVVSGLTYRYADFVTYLGGTEFHLGWIVGVGMVGSVLMRLSLGAGIDRRGPRLIWLGSLVLLAATCLLHLVIMRHDGWAIYLVRVAFCTALAGVWGASTTFIADRVSVARMAERIGMLGTSGFVGIMIGTQLADLLCAGLGVDRGPIDRMFIAAAIFAAAAIPFAWFSTRRVVRPEPSPRPPALQVVRRYQSGMAFVLGTVAGAAILLPATFLRTYAAELHIPRIGLFFTVCAVVAVVSRATARRLPERLGLPRMILVGIGVMTAAQFLFLPVRSEWHLLFPGILAGVAQAILYPTIVTASTSPYPTASRGLATTLILAAFDLGQVIGAPAAALVLHYAEAVDLPGYPAMFISMAIVLLATGLAYYVSWRKSAPATRLEPTMHRQPDVWERARRPHPSVAVRKAGTCATRRGARTVD